MDSAEDSGLIAGSELSLQQIRNIIRRHKRHALIILSASLFISVLNFFSQSPQYSAESMLIVNEDSGQNRPLDALIGSENGVDFYTNTKDVELIKSTSVALCMVKELYKSGRGDSLECLGNRPYVTRLSRFLQKVSSSFSGGGAQASLRNKSLPMVDVEKQQLRNARSLRARISVEPVKNTNLLKVSVSSSYPDEAVYLTNTLCQVYKDEDMRRKAERYEQGKKVIGDMIQEQEQKVENANRALSTFMAAHKIYDFSGNIPQMLGKLNEMESKYNDSQIDSRIMRNNLNALEPNLSSADKAAVSRISQNIDVLLVELLAAVKSCEREYIALLREKGKGDADVQAKLQQLASIKANYQRLSRQKIAAEIGYAGKSQQYNFSLASDKLQNERKLSQFDFASSEYIRLKNYYEAQINQRPPIQQEYAKLQRDQEVATKTYVALKGKLDDTNIMLGSEVGRISIVEHATHPSFAGSNLMASLTGGVVFGFVLMFGFIGYSEVLNERIKDDLFFKSIGLSTLSLIPYVAPKGNLLSEFQKKILHSLSDAEKLCSWQKFTDKLNSKYSESFRTLRTNLDYIDQHHQLKSILVSGLGSGEGKSLICANLAMAYALNGQKTVVVDCDLRRSSQHYIFNLEKEPGLTDYLLGAPECLEEHYLQTTHLKNLFLLSAGTKVESPHEILGSIKMEQLIKALEERFDRVLFDTTPLFFSDVAQLAKSTDGILLVSRLLYSSKTEIKEYLKDNVLSTNIIGVALIDSLAESGCRSKKYGVAKYKEYA